MAIAPQFTNLQKMSDPEEQKMELEKIQRAVSDSLKARRSFRVSKRAVRGFKSQSIGSDVPAIQLDPDLGLVNAYDNQLSLRPDPPHLVSKEDSEDRTKLPIHYPWPSSSTASTRLADHQSLVSASNQSPNTIDEEKENIQKPFTYLPSLNPAANEQDFSLIMNYLDNIFPLQFYFYQPSAFDRGRGWLLALILRSKSAYYTTLAFSVLTHIIFQHNGETSAKPQLSKQLDEYHTLAITELQRQLEYLPKVLNGAEHLRIGVEILSCTIQFLSIEVFRETKSFKGWKNDWEFHLDAAGTMLSVIGNGLAQSSALSNMPVVSEDDLSQFPSSSLSDLAGLDFFMTTYVWSDILRCACFGLKPASSHSFQYLNYLEEGRIRLDRVMGCRNWGMIAIREITDLENWKIDMKKHGNLDMPMLYRKGAAIESRLANGLSSLKQQSNAQTYLDQDCDLISEIYAMSAQIYLAIVLWGNSPHTPAVRVTVAGCLVAIKALPQHLIIRIAFPFCVAGCMASDEEKDSFRAVLYNVESGSFPLGMLWNCLDIMEEFWAMRDGGNLDSKYFAGNSGCPWTIAMENIGTKALLI
ncbi:hypothetical protein IFR05_007637 [Cadophora sp. M221]|nr:hypothetical protein IFR05_007637 [Cadophora sp. M221]